MGQRGRHLVKIDRWWWYRYRGHLGHLVEPGGCEVRFYLIRRIARGRIAVGIVELIVVHDHRGRKAAKVHSLHRRRRLNIAVRVRGEHREGKGLAGGDLCVIESW